MWSPGIILEMLLLCCLFVLGLSGKETGELGRGGRWPLSYTGSQVRGGERTGGDSSPPRALPTRLAPAWGGLEWAGTAGG